MAPSASNVLRRFLSWDRPLLPQAVAYLTEPWTGDGPLDLSRLLVVVPTRQSGRRLREALAAAAGAQGAAVFPPRVVLPESLLDSPAPDVATRLETLVAWISLLRDLPLDSYRALVPIDPPQRSFSWALGLAQQLVRLQRTLAESGLRLGDVGERVGGEFDEAERWQQLGELEAKFDQRLATWQRRDPRQQRIARARLPELPAGVERVVVIGTPDPQPLAVAAWRALAHQVPVEILIHAPDAEAAAFDEWGRPEPEVWGRRPLQLPDPTEHVHLCADPADQAERLAEWVARHPKPEEVLGVGVADPEVLAELEHALGERGIAVFNPEGRRRLGDRLFQLLDALHRLVREPSFESTRLLARCPDFLACLEARLRPGFSAASFLTELDALQTRHLPGSLHEALQRTRATEEASVLARALEFTADLAMQLRGGAFAETVPAVLAEIFGGRRFDLSDAEDAELADAAGVWTGLVAELAGVSRHVALAPSEAWELALNLYGEAVKYDDKAVNAVELQGWLELLWDDAPHLAVAGLNDGIVPDAVVGDPFLPESLRQRLGLKTNAARFARDAYLLQAIAASRAEPAQGRLDLLVGKASHVGDPLRPSRLLLQCADDQLAARVQFLFRAVPPQRETAAWRRAWKLAPAVVSPPGRVSVTGLRAWLACPFRFYLERVLRMEAVDPQKTELDVLDFGTLCHAALEAMGREPALREEREAKVLRDFLVTRLEHEATRRFGTEITLPLVVQLESARQRLSRAAQVQADLRAEGWVIEHVERPFTIDVAGLTVTGKIDRIDRHEGTGAVRVLDYKTSDHPVTPAFAHFHSARAGEMVPVFAQFHHDGRERVWTDLQLPLYLHAAARDPALALAAGLECAYFNLPKAIAETALVPWSDYPRELADAAWRCAEGVATAIRAGVFWPPNEQLRPEYDTFATLFHHGAAESVSWPGPALALEAAGTAKTPVGGGGTR